MSKRMRWGVLAALAAACAALLPAIAGGQQATQFRASLAGADEVPRVTSSASGTFSGTVNVAAGTFDWTLSVPSITNALFAHIHYGQRGANGPIIVPLFNAPTGSPASSINVSGTTRAADIGAPLLRNFAGFQQALRSGTLYINVHTSANPGGEIRGQVVIGAVTVLPQATATPTAPPAPPAATPARTPTPAAPAAPAATATPAAPAAPRTGQAGIVDDDTNTGAAVLLLALAVALVVGGRALVLRRR